MEQQSLANQIYEQLRTAIMGGRISANAMLVEREVTEQFGTSRAPVREALQRLCQEGYLISYPRKGYLINRLSEERLFQIQQVRYQLEILAAKLVIEYASDDQIRSLYPLVEGNGAETSTDPQQTHNTRFHSELARLSGNPVLCEAVRRHLGEASMGAFQFPSIIDQPDRHREIIQALLDRDLAAAEHFLELDMQLDRYRKRIS